MRIIIIGDGKVGHSLAESLVKEEHQVVIIDRSEQVVERNQDTVDALTIHGSGVDVATLQEAEVSRADIVIAVTVSDEINMLSCLTAKRLGAQYAIARVRDQEYNKSLPFLMRELLIDYVINPERILAQEISRMLRYPFSGNIETFARGRVELMDFRLAREDPLVGMALKDLHTRKPACPRVLFCAVERGEEAIIPKGDLVFQEGDRVYVVADIPTITQFFRHIGKNTSGIKSVMVLGAGRIAYYLGTLLLQMNMQVKVIEMHEQRARDFAQLLPGAAVVVGDGTDQEVLNDEGLLHHDAFVTLSGLDEENIMAGLYAHRLGVRKVIVKNSRDSYLDLLGDIGLDSALNIRRVTGDTILRIVRTRSAADAAVSIERLYRLMDGQVEALEFVVRDKDAFINVPLKNLPIRQDALIAVIVRENQVVIPTGEDSLHLGDRVVVVIKGGGIETLRDIMGQDRG